MTKPGFILNRTKVALKSKDTFLHRKVYKNYIDKRNEQLKKSCYCGHTITCECLNPSIEEFKENLFKNNIKEEDL